MILLPLPRRVRSRLAIARLAMPVGDACWRCRGSAAGGGDRFRTDDLLLAKQALSQLSYTPSGKPKADAAKQLSVFCFAVSGLWCPVCGGPGRI